MNQIQIVRGLGNCPVCTDHQVVMLIGGDLMGLINMALTIVLHLLLLAQVRYILVLGQIEVEEPHGVPEQIDGGMGVKLFW